jgi:hypothetical protein
MSKVEDMSLSDYIIRSWSRGALVSKVKVFNRIVKIKRLFGNNI